MENDLIGYIISGSLKDGFIARMTVPAEQVQEGAFVVVESGTNKFYGLITDLRLGASDLRFAEESTTNRLPEKISQLLRQQTLYTEIEILPALMQDVGVAPGEAGYQAFDAGTDVRPMPVKTLPSHQSIVRIANAFDVGEVFGDPEKEGYFAIGTTREQGHPVAIDMDKLVQRSSGIFGATGTGKSYLTRLILAGLIESKKASVLVFDMHDEYAFGDQSSDTGIQVPGLKDKLSRQVRSCAIGIGTEIKGRRTDFDLVLEYSDITPEDVLMLSRELNLRETSASTLSALERCFGPEKWFSSFMKMSSGEGDDSVSDWAKNNNINESAAEALQSKLSRVYQKKYLQEKTPNKVVSQMIDCLQKGISVVLSFGKYQADLDYLLVTNILTRKVREAWEKQTNEAHNGGDKPTPLVIAVEEAHKLLNREMAGQTAFSMIAREMRKYYVTLLIIDQRPSQIYDEVMSQLGTRISGWLGDDADISAVLSGLSGRDSLRGMLARLQPKQEVLLLGYGVPMPIPVQTRRYDENFWKELLKNRPQTPKAGAVDDWMMNS